MMAISTNAPAATVADWRRIARIGEEMTAALILLALAVVLCVALNVWNVWRKR
jgi:hypothetical protein